MRNLFTFRRIIYFFNLLTVLHTHIIIIIIKIVIFFFQFLGRHIILLSSLKIPRGMSVENIMYLLTGNRGIYLITWCKRAVVAKKTTIYNLITTLLCYVFIIDVPRRNRVKCQSCANHDDGAVKVSWSTRRRVMYILATRGIAPCLNFSI